MQDVIEFDRIDKDGPQSYRATFELNAEELDRVELDKTGPVTIEVQAAKGDHAGEYILDGTSTFTADLRCSRCDEPYPFANTSPFHLRFRPRPEGSEHENEEIEISDEELDVEFYSERAVPLKDLALEQIQLAIPMKPLCEEGCLGLCPQCGVNRRREACKCETSVVDDRWGALAGIRDELKKRES
jgi:uncharacterized protein